MSTATKTKKPAVRPLPPSKFKTDDLLADVRSGRFGKGVDWAAVDRAVRKRRRSRAIRPVS